MQSNKTPTDERAKCWVTLWVYDATSVLTIPLGWYAAVNAEGHLCHNIWFHFSLSKKGRLRLATYIKVVGQLLRWALEAEIVMHWHWHRVRPTRKSTERECDVLLCPRLNNITEYAAVMPDVGSNEVQILNYCTFRDFSGICTVSFSLLLPTFAYKY